MKPRNYKNVNSSETVNIKNVSKPVKAIIKDNISKCPECGNFTLEETFSYQSWYYHCLNCAYQESFP